VHVAVAVVNHAVNRKNYRGGSACSKGSAAGVWPFSAFMVAATRDTYGSTTIMCYDETGSSRSTLSTANQGDFRPADSVKTQTAPSRRSLMMAYLTRQA
jgi:hypothetical protein